MNAATDLWEELLADSLNEHGVVATVEQISAIAKDIQVGHENMHLAFHNPGAGHLLREIDDLKKQVVCEREKRVCPECKGRGVIEEWFGPIGRGSSSRCGRCHGEGKVSP